MVIGFWPLTNKVTPFKVPYTLLVFSSIIRVRFLSIFPTWISHTSLSVSVWADTVIVIVWARSHRKGFFFSSGLISFFLSFFPISVQCEDIKLWGVEKPFGCWIVTWLSEVLLAHTHWQHSFLHLIYFSLCSLDALSLRGSEKFPLAIGTS